MPAQQKALYLDSKFGNFVIQEREIPKAGSKQLLVRIEATGLNPIDWTIQKAGLFIEEYPAILGTDITGVVEEVGKDVSGFSKGDRVFFQGSWSNDTAGYQQYTLADAETTAKIPSKISFEAAATIPVTIAVTVAGLYIAKPHGVGLTAPLEASTKGIYRGKSIVVLGGATSVGQYVIQFAKLSGFSAIITTASTKHTDYLKSLGATHVVDRNKSFESLRAEITKITTAPTEIVYDAVSKSDTQQIGYDLLAKGGSLITVLPKTHTETEGEDKASLFIIGVWTLPYTRELGIKLYSKLPELLEEGAIKPNRVEVLKGGLQAVSGGLERLGTDQVSGVKLVVRPQETAE